MSYNLLKVRQKIVNASAAGLHQVQEKPLDAVARARKPVAEEVFVPATKVDKCRCIVDCRKGVLPISLKRKLQKLILVT